MGQDKGFDLAPDCGVVLDFDVAFGEGTGDPGVAGGGDVVVFVAEVDVTEDFGGGGVGGVDGWAPVQEAFGLVEVDGLGYVGGNEAVVGLALIDAVDLGDEEDGDAVELELAGYGYGFGCSPGVTVEDDAGVFICDVLDCDEAEDFAVGVVAVVVREDFGVDGGGVLVAEMESEGDLSVDGAGALDEAAGEAYYDELGWGFQAGCDCRGG